MIFAKKFLIETPDITPWVESITITLAEASARSKNLLLLRLFMGTIRLSESLCRAGLPRLPQLGGHGGANPLIFHGRAPKRSALQSAERGVVRAPPGGEPGRGVVARDSKARSGFQLVTWTRNSTPQSMFRRSGRLKDNCGSRHVRARGHAKVHCHLMFGILVLTVDQLMRLLT